jgi:alpha-tubulin suppressor-like RCC1 family protein
MEDGNATCWGNNGHGQLGYEDTQHRGDDPFEMGQIINVGTEKIIEVLVAGDGHTCALLKDGNAKCWGKNNHGQLGYGDTQDRGDNPHEMGDNLAKVLLSYRLLLGVTIPALCWKMVMPSAGAMVIMANWVMAIRTAEAMNPVKWETNYYP